MSIAEDQSKTVIGFPIMNPAGEAVISGNQASTGGGVYPYAAPPPGPFDSDPQRLRRASTLRCIIFCVISCILIVILILILILTTPVIPDVQLDSASVSSFNVSTSGLTANWDLGLTIIDPNKKVHYDKFVAYMVYNGENLAGTSLLSLDQQNRKHIRMQVKFTAASAYVSDDAAKSMAADRIQGAVNFDLKLVSWERSSSSKLMIVECNNIRVSFSSDSGLGTFSDQPGECHGTWDLKNCDLF